MATHPRSPAPPEVAYPTGDGKPVGETPVHRDLLLWTIHLLQEWFRADPMTYVSGNMFLYYVRGDRRKHVSPDVFVTRGIADDGRRRDAYFVWEEGKGPDFVIEYTSKSTRREDQVKKFELYRDVLNVRESFLFDPYGEYLKPPLRGFRLVEGQYLPIEPVAGRLPSEVTGLHLEPAGEELRLVNPATGRHLLTLPRMQADFEQRVREAEAVARESQEMARHSEEARQADRVEMQRMRREIEELRQRPTQGESTPRPGTEGT
jgi:Uma2 family endonuclease